MVEFRPVAPYIYLTIGDLFDNTPGYFSSVGITIPESATWEISDGVQVPQVCDVSAEFTYIGKQTPHTIGKQYDGLWWVQGKHLDVGGDRTDFVGNYPNGDEISQRVAAGEFAAEKRIIDGQKLNLKDKLKNKILIA